MTREQHRNVEMRKKLNKAASEDGVNSAEIGSTKLEFNEF